MQNTTEIAREINVHLNMTTADQSTGEDAEEKSNICEKETESEATQK